MPITDTIKAFGQRLLGYKIPIGPRGGTGFYEMLAPPSWGYQTYLKAYGEIGWLYACCTSISHAVAKQPWHLYNSMPDGDREEIDTHPLIDLLRRPNPFQTRYQFFYLTQLYINLVGEAFWQINYNKKGYPAEMWLAPPAFMVVVPSQTNYIDHYEFRRQGEVVRFDVDEIIHIFTPNPLNPFRGISPAMALTTDLDSERFASRHQQRLFYNDGTPGFMLEFPDMPPSEERKNLMVEWDERHRGFRNAHRVGFLWGGAKANTIALNNREMEFEKLRKLGKDVILGAYGVPQSVLGISENVNRANAEAAQYTYAEQVIQPKLVALREPQNESLCPLFEDGLELDFENPVPENVEMQATQVREDFKAGIITRQEARSAREYDPEASLGDTFLISVNVQEVPVGQIATPPAAPAFPKSKAIRIADKEAFWKRHIENTESYEKMMIDELRTMWKAQKGEAVDAVRRNAQALIDLDKAKKHYAKEIEPIMAEVMLSAMKHGYDHVAPQSPHKILKQPSELNSTALRWLKSRIMWASAEVGEQTADLLAQALSDGYAAGESIDKIAKRVEDVFGFSDEVRALRIARTEIMAASNEGALQGYADSGVVEEVEFHAAIDERVCADCSDMDGDVETLEDASHVLPLHVSCRCIWLPLVG